jgi:hypothetical protein
MSDTRTAAATKKKDPGEKKQSYQPYATKKDGIPMLHYGKGNNFHKFKHALSEAALNLATSET